MFENNNQIPLYIQISEAIMIQIFTHHYQPKAKLPSVRDLSVLTKTNPNTVQKALSLLEDQGLIQTERTNGKFITDDLKLIKQTRDAFILKKTQSFLEDMKMLDVNLDDLKQIIDKELIK